MRWDLVPKAVPGGDQSELSTGGRALWVERMAFADAFLPPSTLASAKA